MKVNAINLIERKLNIAAAKSEFKRIQLFIIALLLGLIIMSITFFLIEGTTNFFKNKTTKYFIVLWFATFLVYEIIGYFIAKSYLKKKIVVPDFMKLGNVTIEAAFPSFLLFLLCYLEKTAIFLDSPLMLFYFILIGLSALNMEIRLSLITGLVSTIGYFSVTIWAINTFDSNNEVLYFPPILYEARSVFMLIAALGAVFVAKETKNRVNQLSKAIDKKNKIESLFGQQVSQKVAKTLLTDNYLSEKREVSVLFMDIRNFSSFAEHNNPQDVIRFQNAIFSPIIRIISKYNGITNQIMGDGLMATFGAPLKDKNHAKNALEAGLAILNEVKTLSSSKVIHETRIGIGIHTGKVVMGNIGNEMRKQFSISGTAVIIAARLEQLNKEHGSQFLVSQEFYNQIDKTRYSFEALDELQLRNINQKVKVYKVA